MVCRRQGEGGRGPAWLPTTYNLETELEQFVTCYQVCLGLGSGFGVSVFGLRSGSSSALVWVLGLGSGSVVSKQLTSCAGAGGAGAGQHVDSEGLEPKQGARHAGAAPIPPPGSRKPRACEPGSQIVCLPADSF